MRASDDTGFVHLIWFAGSPRHIESLAPRGERRLVTGKVERFNNEVQIAHPDYILPLEKADEIPLSEPVYPATQGLTSRVVRKLAQGALAARARNWPSGRTPPGCRRGAGPDGARRWRRCTRRHPRWT